MWINCLPQIDEARACTPICNWTNQKSLVRPTNIYHSFYSDISFVFHNICWIRKFDTSLSTRTSSSSSHIRPATIYHPFYPHNLFRLLSHSLNSQIRHFRPTIIYHLSHYFSISKDPWLYHFTFWNLFLAHSIHLYHYQLRWEVHWQ